MLHRLIYTILLTASLFSSASFASNRPAFIDPESIKHTMIQTRNGLGANFNDLGSFEEGFINECRLVDLEEMNNGKILLLGEGYGRLTMRVLRETEYTHVFSNELSPLNICHLETKLRDLKAEGDKKFKANIAHISELIITARAHTLVGDCLQLNNNKELVQILRTPSPYNSFDKILSSNMIHFFDGEQVLKFFINGFNLLKPGGTLHVMAHSFAKPYSEEEILKAASPTFAYVAALAFICEFASQEKDLIFPGLIDDKWLSKSEILKTILRMKPNTMHTSNAISPATLERLATQVGFEIISVKNYTTCKRRSDQHVSFAESEEKSPYSAIVLRKPRQHDGQTLIMRDLDQDFVSQCVNASKKMKEFMDTRLEYPENYPYVQLKKK